MARGNGHWRRASGGCNWLRELGILTVAVVSYATPEMKLHA